MRAQKKILADNILIVLDRHLQASEEAINSGRLSDEQYLGVVECVSLIRKIYTLLNEEIRNG